MIGRKVLNRSSSISRKKRVLKATVTYRRKLKSREHTETLIQEQLTLFLFHKPLQIAFKNKVCEIRDRVGIPELFKEDDCSQCEFQDRDYFIGIDSIFLNNNHSIKVELEKVIYKELLVPLKWSYDFYPFIEHFVLYGSYTKSPIQPNPHVHKLIIHKKSEVGRNKYTVADKVYVKRKLLGLMPIGKIDSKDTKLFTDIIEGMLTIQKSNDRRSKGKINLFGLFKKACCFQIFNDYQENPDHFIVGKTKGGKDVWKVSAAQMFSDDYNQVFTPEIKAKTLKKLSDEHSYFYIRKIYPEYQKYLQIAKILS